MDGGWQYFDPDEEAGFLMAFRRKESLSDTVHLSLKGLKPDVIYEFTDADSGEKRLMIGKDARADFSVVINECMASRLVRYCKK